MKKLGEVLSKEKESTESQTWVSRLIQKVAYPFALVAGYWSFSTTLKDSAYDTLKHNGVFKDILPEHKSNLQSIMQEGENAAHNSSIASSILKKFKNEHRDYTEKVTNRMKERGVNGIFAQWDLVHRTHRQRAIMDGLTIAGITIGAVLAIAHSKVITQLFSDQPENKKAGQQR